MHPQLAAIVNDLDAAHRRVQRLDASLTPDDWGRRPASGRWSPAECLAHLNLTSEAALPVVRESLQTARERQQRAAGRYRRDAMGWLVWQVLAPSRGLRTKAIEALVPRRPAAPDTLVREFGRLQAEFGALVRAADGLALDAIRVLSPFDRRVRCNLYAALTLVPRHQHRHLNQAEQAVPARRVPGSPASTNLGPRPSGSGQPAAAFRLFISSSTC